MERLKFVIILLLLVGCSKSENKSGDNGNAEQIQSSDFKMSFNPLYKELTKEKGANYCLDQIKQIVQSLGQKNLEPLRFKIKQNKIYRIGVPLETQSVGTYSPNDHTFEITLIAQNKNDGSFHRVKFLGSRENSLGEIIREGDYGPQIGQCRLEFNAQYTFIAEQ